MAVPTSFPADDAASRNGSTCRPLGIAGEPGDVGVVCEGGADLSPPHASVTRIDAMSTPLSNRTTGRMVRSRTVQCPMFNVQCLDPFYMAPRTLSLDH